MVSRSPDVIPRSDSGYGRTVAVGHSTIPIPEDIRNYKQEAIVDIDKESSSSGNSKGDKTTHEEMITKSRKMLLDSLGVISEQSGRPENQDTHLQMITDEGNLLIGVFDGHGKYGKGCAQKAMSFFRKEAESGKFKSRENLFSNITESFIRAHKHLQEEQNDDFNCRWSGTTAVLAFLYETELVVANLGDTDGVIGKVGDDEQVLTTSHRPEDEIEKARVIKAGGRVDAKLNRSGERLGPLRVWMKDLETPGLMVTRTLGDVVSHEQLGVSEEPSINVINFVANHDILILASDGVWDFVPPKEAVEFVRGFVNAQDASESLVQLALSRQEHGRFDNVTAIVVFLQDDVVQRERMQSHPEFARKTESKKKTMHEAIQRKLSRNFSEVPNSSYYSIRTVSKEVPLNEKKKSSTCVIV